MSRWTMPLSDLAGALSLSRGARSDIEMRSPVPLSRSVGRGSLFSGRAAVAGYETFMEVYGEDAVVHPIVSRLAESTAEADWHLYVKSRTGDDQDRTEVMSHGVLDLLGKPNDFQTFNQIMEAATQHFYLVGELDIVLGFMAGVKLPLDMWVLRPDRITPVPDPLDFLTGWVYTSPDGGEKIPLETRELLRTLRPSPLDPYRGMGAIQALMRDLDAQKYTKEWQAAFFQNSARPGGVITVDRRLADEEFLELRERWAEQHRGLSKAHRVAILEHGAQWTETAFSLRDMQMAELDTVGRDRALVAFGMPKSMLGIVEDVNRANAEASEYLFARWIIRPMLQRWKSMLNAQLLPLFGERAALDLELDFDDPVPANSEQGIAELAAKAEAVVKLVGAGFDAAQVLEMVDWPDLGYEKPEPPQIVAPEQGNQRAPGQGGGTASSKSNDGGGMADALVGSIDMAMRWKVVGHRDDSCCDPCRANLGKLYRNRSSAYADYPGGKSYIKCVGEKFGNHCRCRVIKRRSE